ncbi:hypothetical protein BDI4_690039 [Burkholderia diffusa]|nr:hypothetical protein BDI4_690039 [Burkholderia diffusa]
MHRAAYSFMIPPAPIVLDWPVARIVGQSLDFQALCSFFPRRGAIVPFAASFEPDFEQS